MTMQLATLERQVRDIWEREREELREMSGLMLERINRFEGSQLAGLSLEDAAVTVLKAHGRLMSYFELFDILKVAVLAPEENPVSLWRKLSKSKKVRRASGTLFGLPRTGAGSGDTDVTAASGRASS